MNCQRNLKVSELVLLITQNDVVLSSFNPTEVQSACVD